MADLALAGCVIRFDDSGGDGRAVIFSHGAGADRTMFRAQHAHLAALGYRVISWDQRGHGESLGDLPYTAARGLDDLEALVARLALDHPVLVGQSLGGNLSQAAVRARPTAYSALIVMDSAWNAAPLSRLDRALLAIATPTLRVIPWRWLPGIMAQASAETTDARAALRATFKQLGKARFLDAWQATVELLDPLPGYRTPIPLCLIRGSEDRTGTIATLVPQWAAAEGIDEIVVAGAGHMVTMDAPEAVNAALTQFLATLR